MRFGYEGPSRFGSEWRHNYHNHSSIELEPANAGVGSLQASERKRLNAAPAKGAAVSARGTYTRLMKTRSK